MLTTAANPNFATAPGLTHVGWNEAQCLHVTDEQVREVIDRETAELLRRETAYRRARRRSRFRTA